MTDKISANVSTASRVTLVIVVTLLALIGCASSEPKQA
jgi:hypothetical protein